MLLWLSTSSWLAAVDFSHDVAPVLQRKCVRCHDASTKKGELDLSSWQGIQAGSESGAVVTAGDPEASRLYEVVRDGEMPPADEATRLSAAEIELLKAWITSVRAAPPAQPLNQHDVLPILLAKCAECHGRQLKEGDLDIRSLDRLLQGGTSGPAIVRGDPGNSRLVQRIQRGEMPPREKLAKYSVKPVSDAELARIEQWIQQGAPWVDLPPDAASGEHDPLVNDDDRQHWAFQTPRLPSLPSTNTSAAVNEIDVFIQRRLTTQGLSPSPPADRATLLRRLTFDLTGLPAEPQHVKAFLQNESPSGYEQVVDRLLASPAYGERWGQYWLDLAGYADSEGVQHADPIRPHAYRYRDYVIRAFNGDKPYDRFLLEQIAGDELADYETAPQITPQLYDNLVATGFLRMSADGTFAGITGFLPNRLDVIDDQIRILSSTVMGLTIRCARCHSHKFDPIPQRDYYRLTAILKGAMDEFDWLRPLPGSAGSPRYLPHVTTQERAAWEQQETRLKAKIAALKSQQEALEKPHDNEQSTAQAEALAALEQAIKQLESLRSPEPMIRALWDNGEPSPTYLLIRGDYQQPARVVGPGVPSVLTDGRTPFDAAAPWPGAKKTGNRLALARWLTQHDHPLTARVLVNRIWKHHFGRGLVEPLDDFGRAGGTPTHPQLLDWLARRFVQHGYSLKWLHRQIVCSSTYRQASAVRNEHRRLDPDNRCLSRMPLRRMEAEVLRDSLIAIANRLNRTQFGPPDAVEARQDGLVTTKPRQGSWRRSIYVLKRRTQRLTLLDNFDRPRMSPNCVDRTVSNVAPQALHLMNNAMIRELSSTLARRIRGEVGADRDRQLEQLYLLAIGRSPQLSESLALGRTMQLLEEAWDASAEEGDALANICHAVVNSAAFLYID